MYSGNLSILKAEEACYIRVSEGLKSFKSIKIIKRVNLKLPLVFATLKSIESRFARFVGQFYQYSREFEEKQKQDQKQLGIRFAHKVFYSLRSV
jgi:hypothetical protein